ncbi:MAG: HAMP domain-containing protein [Anaerolineae bacterium]|nr:HAMP domain-containing protein [Anaerolineae bacterium]
MIKFNLRAKILGGFLLIVAMMLVITAVSYFNMKAIDDGMVEMYHDRTLPIAQIGAADTELYRIRGSVFKYVLIPDQRQEIMNEIRTSIEEVNRQMDLYRATNLVEEEKQALQAFDLAWSRYQGAVEETLANVNAGNQEAAMRSLLDGGETSDARKEVGAAMDELIAINARIASELNQRAKETFERSTVLLVAVSLLGLLTALGLGIFISRRISRAAKEMVATAEQIAQVDLANLSALVANLSEGDFTISQVGFETKPVAVRSQDEMGELASAFNLMIGYLAEVARSFESMVDKLREAILQVAESANSLDAASGDLAAAAEQSAQAASQMAVTLQEMARGITQQTDSISITAGSVEQMKRAIEGVAKGAQEQAMAVSRAAEVTTQLTVTIQEVAAVAQEQAAGAGVAAEATRQSAAIVEDTVQGMQTIRERVSSAMEKVKDMGARSEQIGSIVEAIEDIASQTNLLALNAAIEAARAGEHGKGFAVVADEVRKLAEKSASAAKEIGSLIKLVQDSVAEVVAAMDASSSEVERGVALSLQSGQALRSVMETAQKAVALAEKVSAAAGHMTSLSNELVDVMDNVSAVVEENNASTEEMAAGSSEVAEAIEVIASVSEQNSASVEEISASAEEMNAQSEEVTSSALSLADMASQLTLMVSRFKVGANEDLRAQLRSFGRAHIAWITRLNEMLEGRAKLNGNANVSHTECLLGRWYYSAGKRDFGSLREFSEIEQPHKRFHEAVHEVVEAYNRGARLDAKQRMTEVVGLSKVIIEKLHLLEQKLSSN